MYKPLAVSDIYKALKYKGSILISLGKPPSGIKSTQGTTREASCSLCQLPYNLVSQSITYVIILACCYKATTLKPRFLFCCHEALRQKLVILLT